MHLKAYKTYRCTSKSVRATYTQVYLKVGDVYIPVNLSVRHTGEPQEVRDVQVNLNGYGSQ